MSRPKSQKEAVVATKEASDTPGMLDQTRITMAKACRALDSCIDEVTAKLDEGQYNKDLASHLAWMTKQLAGVAAELRKLEAHEKKIGNELTPDERFKVVMAYLDTLPADRQAAVLAKLQTGKARGMLSQ